MDVSGHSQNQSYWFVVREVEDPSNVVFNGTNNFAIQTPQIASASTETRYILDPVDNRQFIQIAEPAPKASTEPLETEIPKITTKEDFWNQDKIKILLKLTSGDRYGNINKEKEFWDEISPIIDAPPEECAKKYRILRNTYIRLTKKKRLGRDVKWVHYALCEEAFKNCKSLPPATLETWEESKIKRMLTLYIENLPRFRDPNIHQKDVWKDIAAILGTTEYNCYYKFRVLKRTYRKCLERSRETGKFVKWPYYSYYERIFYNYNPGPWDRTKVKLLLNAYSQSAYKFVNPKYQKKELWRDISNMVGETASDCDRKFRNLKQTYLKLKFRTESGRGTTKWSYYKDFQAIDNILKTRTNTNTENKLLEDNYIRQLLSFYIENKEKFRTAFKKKKHLWGILSPKLGLSPEECDRKFRNLKQTYWRLAEKKRLTGKITNWPYFSYFERIYGSSNDESRNKVVKNCMLLSEIRKVVKDVQDRRENDLKFEKLVQVAEESNKIQRERNMILKAFLDNH